MNVLPSLSAWPFALAGLACATAPLIIHLLNRRRFRTVRWAAMDFLREALKRNRRIMEVRDLALLALRTLAVLLFGFALARPFISAASATMWSIVFPSVLAGMLGLIVATALWAHRVVRTLALAAAVLLFCAAGGGVAMQISQSQDAEHALPDANQPVHAVLVVDNSLSMGRRAFAGNLLDAAKERARQFIDRLPGGSRISVIPLCGSELPYGVEAHRATDNALEALRRIDVVDRSASVQRAINEARKAAEQVSDLTPRHVFFTDQQEVNWRGYTPPADDEQRVEMQIVEVRPETTENTWIADLRVEDGLADVETPATISVVLGYSGLPARRSVQVALSVDGTEAASKTVDLDAGEGTREVAFQYAFNTWQPEPGKPAFVPISASLGADQLSADDQRHLVAHVVAALPVVFVDQFGAKDEDLLHNRVGETASLRRLLAPVTSRTEVPRHLVAVRHVAIDDLDRTLLEDARLVVVAGVSDPGASVELLRQYVEQGGQLLIAAGGAFDPARWQAAAWEDGAGILPVPLADAPVGATPEEAPASIRPLVLAYETMAGHSYFEIADVSEEELRDLYTEPYFFKAIDADLSRSAQEAFAASEVARLEQRYARQKSRDEQRQGNGAAAAVGEPLSQQTSSDWLLWGRPDDELDFAALPADAQQRKAALEEHVRQRMPRVLARFAGERRLPYLVERRIGTGRVLLSTSGLSSSWNTLPLTNTMLMFDRVLRGMVQATLPPRTFEPRERITLPIGTASNEISVQLQRPGRAEDREILDTGFIGERERGVTVSNALTRGLYRVSIEAAAESTDPSLPREGEEMVFAVNGPAEESNLSPPPREALAQRIAGSGLVLVGPGETINLTGGKVRGQDTWWYVVLAVLVFLLAEIAILAWPKLSPRPAASA